MASVVLVTGGARSGKSMFALQNALERPGPRVFIATAVACDDEMRRRIENHRRERTGQFLTVEAPYLLAEAVTTLPGETTVACIDCLTVWLGNLLFRFEAEPFRIEQEIDAFIAVLETAPCDLVIVTNEVGYGIVPENAMARRFRDDAGALNRRVAQIAQKVYLCVCGIPVNVKE
jgi:adenosylcobinamide kinase / adenosylcobinamide-phosphate guanylyltransferase